MDSTNELYHHGILGMKWGIRRTPEELGHEILKNDAKQAEVAVKIAKIERAHAANPNRGYRKSEARIYKKADKLKQERVDLEAEREVAEKWKAAADAKREYEDTKRAQKDAKKEEKAQNSHGLQSKPLSQMSDRELADYLTRKANEQRYLQLNPPKETAVTRFTKFAGKNAGKAGQALVDVGIEVGKEALKKELQKQLNNQPSPNTHKKYQGRVLSSMTDKEIKEYSSRLKDESSIASFLKNINSGGDGGNNSSNGNKEAGKAMDNIIKAAHDIRFTSNADPWAQAMSKTYTPNSSGAENLDEIMRALNAKGLLTYSV